MEQTKALNALEPFLALSKYASSPRAAADLISKATSAPNTYVFTELLLTPQIQALRTSPEHAAFFQLLSIFCYGTYETYAQTSDVLPPLNDAQAVKLRQLSLITLSQDPNNLTYSNLISRLGLEGSRALENLVISTIYSGLVSGTLDPYNQRVCISSVAPLRDLAPSSIPALISTLKEWSSRCATTLSSIESQIASIKSNALSRQRNEQERQNRVESMIEKEGHVTKKDPYKQGAGGRRGGDNMKRALRTLGTDVHPDEMDMGEDDDVETDSDVARNAKRRGFGGGAGD